MFLKLTETLRSLKHLVILYVTNAALFMLEIFAESADKPKTTEPQFILPYVFDFSPLSLLGLKRFGVCFQIYLLPFVCKTRFMVEKT